jgi:high-affinity iron transporter
MTALHEDVRAVRAAALRSGVPLVPDAKAAVALGDVQSVRPPRDLQTDEIRGIVEALEAAQAEYGAGRTTAALHAVEQAYLQQFEPIEARLAGPVTRRVESLIHIRLRPMLARGATASEVDPVFGALYSALEEADASLAGGSSFWFGAVNAFAIIMREGLEAVLLIAAMLAYLSGIGAQRVHRQRIWMGAAAGVAASFGTWWLARTLLPVSGASREILEGVTALVAVAVLVYVSHWLFQKTYIHDWKNYLRSRMGTAVTAGSVLAMAGLAFAAVYREGFETVLFYQALLYDSSSTAVLAGFLPGIVIITAIGAGILRLGAKLPLRQLFAVTNSILLWLAFVFLGKGIYNLQEAGLFAPHPLAWMPDNEALRQLLGIYPLVETLLAQLAFLTVLLSMYVYYRRRVAPAAPAGTAVADRAPAAAS